jgi:Ca-activated chloride channel family protein
MSFVMLSGRARIECWGSLTAAVLLCGAVTQLIIPQSSLGAASAQGTIFVEANLVVLPVRVSAADGSFVSGLLQEQFRVYENGRPQRITFFREEDVPVTVGLIVDHSSSMGSKLASVAEAVSAFAQSSNPGDEMFVVDFSDNVSLEESDGKSFTDDPKELAKAVLQVSAGGMTALYDAVAESVGHLQFGRSERKALIIVSDGGDNASHHKYADILERAQRSQVIIYAISLVGSLQQENPVVLRHLCKETGGLDFSPGENQSVSSISMKIARDIRQQYTVGFAPERRNDDSFRKIRVEVTASRRGKLRVRTRSGYFAASHKPSPAGNGKDRP